MSRQSPSSGQVQPAVALILGAVAVVGLVALVTFGRPAVVVAPSPSAPVSTPVPTKAPPSSAPSTPSPVPTLAPSVVTKVTLDVADDHEVVAAVQDPDGIVDAVKTGRAADGMSVRWHGVKAENLDDRTIRFTWVGLPQDEQVDIAITKDGGDVSFRIVQAGPYANTDALGSDRVLVVTFASPVHAADIATEVLDRTVH
jgi:hypothetical protein